MVSYYGFMYLLVAKVQYLEILLTMPFHLFKILKINVNLISKLAILSWIM